LHDFRHIRRDDAMRKHADMVKKLFRAIAGVVAFGILSLSASVRATTESGSARSSGSPAKGGEPIAIKMTADQSGFLSRPDAAE
jgi:hypothetical protein